MVKLALAALPASLLLFVAPGGAAGVDVPLLASPPISMTMVSLADGGCRHTIKVHNNGSRTVAIRWSNSSVRNKVGFWKQLYGGGFGVFYKAPNPAEFPVASGKSYSWIFTTDFGCSANRRWRFDLRRSDGNSSMLYYPSSSSYSKNTTVDLGDVGRSSLW